MTDQTHEWDRVPAIERFADTAKFAETYGFPASSGEIALEGQFFASAPQAIGDAVFVHAS